MNDFKLRVLLLEDNPADVLLLQSALETDQLSAFELTHVERLADALSRLQPSSAFDILIADLGLPDSSGLRTFERLHAAAPELPVVIFSGNADEAEAVQAVQAGAQDYLVKSLGGFEIASRTLRYALERHKAQAALRESEARFSKAFNHSPIGMVLMIWPASQIVDINQAALHIWGYSRVEVMGHTTQQLGLAANPAEREKLQLRLTHEGYLHDVETQICRKDGVVRDVIISIEKIEINHQAHLLALLIDNTERKRAEIELRLQGEIMANMSEGINLVRVSDGTILYTNPQFDQMFDYDPGELIGQPVSVVNVSPEPGQPDIRQAIQSGMEASGIWSGEVHNIKKNGELFWCFASVRLFDHPALGQVGLAVQTDITKLKESERALRQSEEQYRLLSEQLEERVQQRTAEVQDLYENAPSGYHSLDAEGCFVTINQTELNWLGYTRSEVLGRSFTEFVTPQGAATFRENFAKFRETGLLTNLEMELKRKDGSVLPVLVNATAIYNANGQYVMSRSTVSDITERKKAEIALLLSRDELRAAYLALEKASRAKDEFLANMSHELRTPLNGILGISEILLEGVRGPLTDHQQRLVSAIDNSGRHLLSLINDILDLSKIEAGRLDLHPETVSVQEVCQASLAFIRQAAVAKGVGVDFLPDLQATTLVADVRQLKQILVNLLSNAVKFTAGPGQVTLTTRAHHDEGRLEFSVTDTGMGISAEDLQRLFSPFTQVDSSLTRQHEGTGLGLALVKRLTELHGGTVSVVSEVGQGSCFTVSLPWQPTDTAPAEVVDAETMNTLAPAIPDAPVKLVTILLAEDTETNIMMMGDYLEQHGYQMVYARNGYEALEQARLTCPDLILMDIQMPQLDGLEAIRRLRANPQFATTPIIALTALAMPGDRERCLEAGATDYISKPVRLKLLSNLMQDLLDS